MTIEEAPRPPLVCRADLLSGPAGCGRTPEQIGYAEFRGDDYPTDDDYVWWEEGTLNRENGHFLCDDCYVKAGQPSRPWPQRWVAP